MAQRRGNITRERIVEVATELMNDRGYLGVSLEDVAARLHITRPALYYYYSRKDELLADIYNRAQSRLLDSVRQIDEKGLDPLETLYHLVYEHILIVAEHAPVVAVMFEEQHNLGTEQRA
ncbi:MAG: TetR/AcrR family transcriptional regulator, partial [Acidimicrobiales bacterium]